MDSLGPLIGPVVPPAETTRPMRVRSERVSSSSSSNRLGRRHSFPSGRMHGRRCVWRS